ncbi:conserved hypothetical protein [delta proteobacterium NaphS2]|nr:conserved hypothetical protein [delta proteobacterium NaphS2]
MGNKGGGLAWLWIVLAIGAAAAAVWYGWYRYSQPETAEEQVTVEVSVPEKTSPGETEKNDLLKDAGGKAGNVLSPGEKLQGEKEAAERKADSSSGEKDAPSRLKPTGEMVTYQFKSHEPKTEAVKTKTLPEGSPEKTSPEMAADDRQARYCHMIEQYVQDYFQYLDTKKYIQNLKLGQSSYARFKQVMERLAAKPPIPAGEGVDPAIMVKNIYFFCRALDRKNLNLVKEVVVHDRDTLEDNMGLFYQWLMLGKGCPNRENLRPSFDVLYRYAGFFLNTTGGRAYMFRRGLKVRLLVSYYAVQIIYQADKAGRNNYGINVLPYVKMLMEEMGNYSDLIYKENYLKTLNMISAYYSGRR